MCSSLNALQNVKAIMLLQGEEAAKGTCDECELFCSSRCVARKRGYDEMVEASISKTGSNAPINSEDDHKLKKLRSIETGKETNIEIICYVCGSSKDKHRHPLL